MKIKEVKITALIDGELCDIVCIPKSVTPKTISSGLRNVRNLIEEYIANYCSDKTFVDTTLMNDIVAFEGQTRRVGSAMVALGYDSVFRTKIDGRHHYIRYKSESTDEREVKEKIKGR